MFAMMAMIVSPACVSAATVRGTVWLGTDPVPDAWVVLTSAAGTNRSVVTDVTGTYEFGDLEPDRYTLAVDGDLHSGQVALCIARSRETIEYDLGIDLRLESCDVIIATADGPANLDVMEIMASVQVLDEHGRGFPFADVTMSLSHRVLDVRTDAEGRFERAIPLRERQFRVSATAPGYQRTGAASACSASVIVRIYPACPRR